MRSLNLTFMRTKTRNKNTARKICCIFSAQYLPHMGGVERYTSYLAKGLLAKNWQVLVITTNPGTLPDEQILDGVPVLRLPAYPFIDGRFPVPLPGKKFLQLHRKLDRIQPDVVLVNTRFYFHSLYGVLWGWKKGARTLLLDHGSGHLYLPNPGLNLLGQWFEHGITALEKRFCREYYGVSLASVKWLRHFHIKACGILPNAIDLDFIDQRLARPRTDFRQMYQIPPDAVVLVYTGRLIPEKGLLPLRDAFASLVRQHPETYLLLAGDGHLEEELKHTAPPHMFLTGRLSQDEVIDLLGCSDMFCLPSVSEGFSTSVLEAAACGNYLVITDSACPEELIKDSSYASVLPDTRPNTIYKALSAALEEPLRRAHAAEKTRKRLENNFTWEKTLERFLACLEHPAPGRSDMHTERNSHGTLS